MDEYERAFMPGKGEVLYRDKVTIPRWAFALTGGLLTVMGAVGTGLLVGTASPLLAALPLVGGVVASLLVSGILVVFASGRIVVSSGELEFQIGPTGPRVPIDEIESVEIAPSWSRARGLGVKTMLGKPILYNLMGVPEKALWITYKGGRKPMVLVPPDPEAMAAALRSAMSRVRARVEATTESTAEESAELEDDESTHAPSNTTTS